VTKNKVRKVLSTYRRRFEKLGIPKKEFPHDSFPKRNHDFLAHCHGMLDEMEVFIKEDRMDKVFRWLGFLQGCFWRSRIYTVDQMKNHNRP